MDLHAPGPLGGDRGARGFLRDFLTGIGGGAAEAGRLRAAAWVRLLLVVPFIAAPTLIGFLEGLRTPDAHWLARPVFAVWCAEFAVYIALNAATLALRGRALRFSAAASYASLVIELTTNHVIIYSFGTLTNPAVVNIVVAMAVYRVFFDYRMGLCAVALGGCLYLTTGSLELAGLIPVAPGMTFPLVHPAYAQGGALSLVAIAASLIIAFGAVNYGVNQTVKLHRYITESVLRRYLPEPLVRRAARGELRLDAPPDRRVVTVMFTDVVGFTPLSERLGPEALGGLLNHYLTRMCEIAHRHQATVDKFVGDAIMIVFGAPEPLEPSEQARRCVRLALEMQAAIPSVAPEHGLQARTGINTGEAVVGNFGSLVRSDYTVLGPAVNVAARLESRSRPGRILIGPETARLLGDAFALEPAGELELKGVSGKVQAFFVQAGCASAPPGTRES